jgi:16S rRNA (guanine527-N7)-methyltransferase
MQELNTYFPGLSSEQQARYAQLPALYADWNAKINVIARTDVDNLLERHVLHSLAIAHYFTFRPGARILDLGTGGGFPCIPLALFFPETQFVAVDGTGKKIKVVQEVAAALQLDNVDARHIRVEDLKMPGAFDFVVTRAVTTLDKLLPWSQRLLSKKQQHAYPNGLIALKGGDLRSELRALPGKVSSYAETFSVHKAFPLPYFEEKWVVYVQG